MTTRDATPEESQSMDRDIPEAKEVSGNWKVPADDSAPSSGGDEPKTKDD